MTYPLDVLLISSYYRRAGATLTAYLAVREATGQKVFIVHATTECPI